MKVGTWLFPNVTARWYRSQTLAEHLPTEDVAQTLRTLHKEALHRGAGPCMSQYLATMVIGVIGFYNDGYRL